MPQKYRQRFNPNTANRHGRILARLQKTMEDTKGRKTNKVVHESQVSTEIKKLGVLAVNTVAYKKSKVSPVELEGRSKQGETFYPITNKYSPNSVKAWNQKGKK